MHEAIAACQSPVHKERIAVTAFEIIYGHVV
jgi:hypothetical protein